MSAVDNSTVDGVTYNVELSKNLLKQFNELQKGQPPQEDHVLHARPTGTGGMNPNAPVYNGGGSGGGHQQHQQQQQQPQWTGSHLQNGTHPPYPPNKYAPTGQHHRSGSGNGGSGSYPIPNVPAGVMYQQQIQQMRGISPHQQVYPNPIHPGQHGNNNNNMYASPGMHYGSPYGDVYPQQPQRAIQDPMDFLDFAPPLQSQLHGQLQQGGGPQLGYHPSGSYGQQGGYEGFPPSTQQVQLDHPSSRGGSIISGGSASISGSSPVSHSPMHGSFFQEAERGAFPFTGGSVNSPFPAHPHSVSPAPSRSPRAEGSLLHHESGHHSRQASGSIARSLTDSIIADGLLLNADSCPHPAHYSPHSNGAMSPMYESDSGSLVGKPPPLNLSAISGCTSHPPYSGNNSVCGGGGGGGSCANSVGGGSGSSGGTSPIPTGRLSDRLNSIRNAASAQSQFWENDTAGGVGMRGDKPPTPLAHKAVGAPTLGTRHQGPFGMSTASHSGSSSQESTPTHAYAQSRYGSTGGGGSSNNNNGLSPKNGGMTGTFPIGSGLAPGISSLMLPGAPQTSAPSRPGMQSRSSSTSSASASTGLYPTSGTVSPSPYHHQNAPVGGLPQTASSSISHNLSGSTSSGALSSGRRPAGLTDLEYGVNRSMSSSHSDRNLPTLSTQGTTDVENGIFFGSGSSSSSLLTEYVNPAQRREQAVLASQIMLANLTAAPLTNDQLELHKQLYDLSLQQQQTQAQSQISPSSSVAGQPSFLGAQLHGHHRNYRQERQEESSSSQHCPPVVASRPVFLHAKDKQLSIQTVSSIGEDAAEDYLDDEDEFTYSAPTSANMTPKYPHSGANSFTLGTSSSSSFKMDTSFMLSPQSSEQSLETNSPFSNLNSDSFRNGNGRPPSGATPLSLTHAGMHAHSGSTASIPTITNAATAASAGLPRRPHQHGTTDGADVEGSELEAGKDKDSRPASMNSLNSNDSSHLAGIAISNSSTSSEWDAGVQQEEKSSRPGGIRISKTPSVPTTAGACASVGKEDIVSEESKPKSRQLSLMQFFKPAPKASAVPAGGEC